MNKISYLLLVILLMADYMVNAQSFALTISATDNKHDMLCPLKSSAVYQFTVSVKNTDTLTYTVSLDKPSMLPFDTWVAVDNNNGRSLAPGSSTSFVLTLTVPANAQEGSYNLLINIKALRNGTYWNVFGRTLNLTIDNSYPSQITSSIDYTTTSTIRVLYDGYDYWSSFYSNFNLSRTDCGYQGLRNFTLILKDGSGTTKESKTVDATQTREYLFSTNASLTGNTTYYYSVQATDMAGNSNTSSPITAKTKPGKPTNFRIESSSYCRLTLTWNIMPGATSYLIGFHSGTLNSATTNTYTFNNLVPGTSYSFDIRSVGPEGYGDILTSSFLTPAVSEPGFLGGLSICSSSQTIQVTPVSDAISYEWTVSGLLTVNGAQSCTTSDNSVNIETNGGQGIYNISVKANTSCGISSNTAAGTLKVGIPIIGSSSPLAYYDGSTYNSVCNLQSYSTNMNILNAEYVEWTRIAANPTSTSWYQNGNNLVLYFFNVGQTAAFNVRAANGCGGVENQFGFKSISCGGGGGGCNIVYSAYPNPASQSTKVTPNIPAPCNATLKAATVNGSISVYDTQGTKKKVLSFKRYKDMDIDVSDLKEGLYYININDGTTTSSVTLIVKH
jgi:hypothetical protein